MRSRYSAYVLNNAQYVYRTWDENTRPPLKVLRDDSSQHFIRLEVISAKNGNAEDDSGTVEFIANYSIDESGEEHQHHENSYFVKQNKLWVYVNELNKVNLNQ